MRVAWKIFRRDVRRLTHNMIALTVMIGILFIPAIYAWLNIAANIDPYKNTAQIKVAVANEGQGAYLKGQGDLDLGTEVIKSLKKNKKMGWKFTDRNRAIEGVRSGKYYAALVIPYDFSENLISITSGKIRHPQIDYYINEKKNAVAPKVTDTAASTLQTQINQNFVETVAGVVNEKLKSLGDKLTGGLDGARIDLMQKMDVADGMLAQYEELLDKFHINYKKADQNIAKAEVLLDQMDRAAADSKDTLQKSDKLLKQTRKGTTQYLTQLTASMDRAQQTLAQLRTDTVTGAGKMAVPVGKLNGDMASLIQSSKELMASNEELIKELESESSQLPGGQATSILSKLKEENAHLQTMLDTLGEGQQALSNASENSLQFVTAMGGVLDQNDKALAKLHRKFLTQTLPGINNSLDALSQTSGSIRGALDTVPAGTKAMREALKEMKGALKDTDQALSGVKTALKDARRNLRGIRADLGTLASSRAYRTLMSSTEMDPDQLAEFVASPIKLESKSYYKVKNYGSSMTPFYTNLAIWIAGMVLAAVLKLRTDADEVVPEFTVRESYMGRWMLFVTVGMIQGAITVLGDLWLLKVQCLHPWAFLLAGLVTAFVYVNIIFAVTITFNHIGRAICVLLVILQIPGSSGTYPIEMMPGFFRALHPLLPFTYGIDAMRETIAGYYEGYYLHNLLILQIFLIIALFIGLVIQPLIMNLDNLFDERLAETGLMISERENPLKGKLSLNRMLNMVWTLAEDDASKAAVLDRAIRFEERYDSRLRRGVRIFLVLPLGFLLLAFTGLNQKLLFILLWVASLVTIAIALVTIEYIHASLAKRFGMAHLTKKQRLAHIRSLRDGLMAADDNATDRPAATVAEEEAER